MVIAAAAASVAVAAAAAAIAASAPGYLSTPPCIGSTRLDSTLVGAVRVQEASSLGLFAAAGQPLAGCK